MAAMTEQQRAKLWSDIMTALSSAREPLPLLKTDLRAAVDAADQWCSDNAASFNSALPTAFRTTATADQKSRLLEYVIAMRRKVGA